MKMIRNFYFPSLKGDRQEAITSEQPVYVMFVTDGATGDESETQQQMKSASFEPIFWQFMAIGKSRKAIKGGGLFGGLARAVASDFAFLERLDEMRDRYVDNADFFSVEDPGTIVDQELYDLLTTEYPSWVRLAQTKNLLR